MAKAWERAGFQEEVKNGRDFFYCDPEQLNIVTGDSDLLSDRRTRSSILNSLEFMADIAGQGIIQPVVASKNGETLLLDIVVGRRRVAAAKALNDVEALEVTLNGLVQDDAQAAERPAVLILRDWIEDFSERAKGMQVPVMVRNTLSEAEKLGMLISENEHRVGDSPVNKALKMKRLLDVCQDKTFVANTFGYQAALSVDQHLQLLQLSQTVQDAVDDNTVKMSRALKWRAMPHSHQDTELREYKLAVSARGGRNLRSTDTPPTKKKLKAFVDCAAFKDRLESEDDEYTLWSALEVKAVLDWITGEATSAQARARCEVIDFFLEVQETNRNTPRRRQRDPAPTPEEIEEPVTVEA